MQNKVYVGNLSWSTDDETMRQVFGEYGNVVDAYVMKDRETGRSKGYGYVTFSSSEEANNSVNALNEQYLDGRTIKCNLAKNMQ